MGSLRSSTRTPQITPLISDREAYFIDSILTHIIVVALTYVIIPGMAITPRFMAIGFDYGGVIQGHPKTLFRERLCTMLNVSPGEYKHAYYRHRHKINVGNISWAELWSAVLKDLGHSDRLDEVMALSHEVFGGPPSVQMLQLVDELKRLGYKVGLLSNNNLANAQAMRDNGTAAHFYVFQVSAETGFMKPDPQAYQLFADALGATMKELIFIDDSELSLSSAKDCGYTPILFSSYDNTVIQLIELGVLHNS